MKASSLLFGMAILFSLVVFGCSNSITESYSQDEILLPVTAHWDFKNNSASRAGSLDGKDLVILDKTGNGNDLRLQIYNPSGSSGQIENLAFSGESMTGTGGSMEFKGMMGKSQVELMAMVGADFITVDNAPINAETFDEGYTIEFLYQLSPEFTNADRWMGLMRREVTYNDYNTAALGGFEIECGSTNIAISNCKEVQFFTMNSEFSYGTPSIWGVSMDNGGEWYHIAIVNNNEEIKMFINGALGFRNHKPPAGKNINGIYSHDNNARFVIGSSIWNEDYTDQIADVLPYLILDKFLHGNLETVRITAQALDQKDWLISNFTPYVAKMGNNNAWTLRGPSGGAASYVFGFIPDTQNMVKFASEGTGANLLPGYTGPKVMENAAAYLTANKATMKLEALLHLGDVVEDSGVEWQYQAFNAPLMTMVNGGLKVQMGHGNHDQTGANGLYARYFRNTTSDYAKAVSTDGTVNTAGSGYVTFEADSSALLNSYMTVTAGSYEYLFVNMQYSANAYSSAHTTWLRAVLDANPDIPTVIFCHNLFGVSDSEPHKISRNNAGNSVWNIARTYDQVFLMVAGHNHGSGWISETNNAGNEVLMMMVDYQFGYNGGNGYIRFLEFNETANKIYITTFSPAAAYLIGTQKTVYDLNYMTGLGNEGDWNINFSERFSFYSGY